MCIKVFFNDLNKVERKNYMLIRHTQLYCQIKASIENSLAVFNSTTSRVFFSSLFSFIYHTRFHVCMFIIAWDMLCIQLFDICIPMKSWQILFSQVILISKNDFYNGLVTTHGPSGRVTWRQGPLAYQVTDLSLNPCRKY